MIGSYPKLCYKRETCFRNFLKRTTISTGTLYLPIDLLKVNLKQEQICQLWTDLNKKPKPKTKTKTLFLKFIHIYNYPPKCFYIENCLVMEHN